MSKDKSETRLLTLVDIRGGGGGEENRKNQIFFSSNYYIVFFNISIS